MKNINFVAIDFETATTAKGKLAACQLGIAVVEKGIITDKKSYLIQPPNNQYSKNTILVHGLTPEDTKDSPTFGELWNEIKPYFEHRVIVSHGNNNINREISLFLCHSKNYHHICNAKILN